MIAKTLLIVSLCLGCLAQAKPIDHQYANWETLSKKHVRWLPDQNQSRTDYAGFKAEHAQLNLVLAELSDVTQAEFDQWTSAQQMAFLINAYNAFTVELILTKYPDLKSIKELGSLIQSPWKKKFFKLFGVERNLDWIENDMLRARYKDPRIHVGINCASIGCQALRWSPHACRVTNKNSIVRLPMRDRDLSILTRRKASANMRRSSAN